MGAQSPARAPAGPVVLNMHRDCVLGVGFSYKWGTLHRWVLSRLMGLFCDFYGVEFLNEYYSCFVCVICCLFGVFRKIFYYRGINFECQKPAISNYNLLTVHNLICFI